MKRFVCVHDCGLIVNPDGLRAVISANLIQSLGRSLKEEVTFNRTSVTSVDWETYRVARASDVPDQIEIFTLNHPELPPGAQVNRRAVQPPPPLPMRFSMRQGFGCDAFR